MGGRRSSAPQVCESTRWLPPPVHTDGANDESTPFYPCDLPEVNIVCVGATDQNDQPAWFTNYGVTSVDLFAPGVNILSTYPGGYAYDDGTSMATPMVTGTLALMLQHHPSLTTAQLKSELLASVDQAPQLAGLAATSGQLDAAAAVATAGGDSAYAAPTNRARPPEWPCGDQYRRTAEEAEGRSGNPPASGQHVTKRNA